MEKPDLSSLSPEMQEYVKSLQSESTAKDEALNSLAEQISSNANAPVGVLKIKKGKQTYIMKYSKIRHEGKEVSYEALLKNDKLFAEILEKDCGSFELEVTIK